MSLRSIGAVVVPVPYPVKSGAYTDAPSRPLPILRGEERVRSATFRPESILASDVPMDEYLERMRCIVGGRVKIGGKHGA